MRTPRIFPDSFRPPRLFCRGAAKRHHPKRKTSLALSFPHNAFFFFLSEPKREETESSGHLSFSRAPVHEILSLTEQRRGTSRLVFVEPFSSSDPSHHPPPPAPLHTTTNPAPKMHADVGVLASCACSIALSGAHLSTLALPNNAHTLASLLVPGVKSSPALLCSDFLCRADRVVLCARKGGERGSCVGNSTEKQA